MVACTVDLSITIMISDLELKAGILIRKGGIAFVVCKGRHYGSCGKKDIYTKPLE
jgi:hypothetical protein